MQPRALSRFPTSANYQQIWGARLGGVHERDFPVSSSRGGRLLRLYSPGKLPLCSHLRIGEFSGSPYPARSETVKIAPEVTPGRARWHAKRYRYDDATEHRTLRAPDCTEPALSAGHRSWGRSLLFTRAL